MERQTLLKPTFPKTWLNSIISAQRVLK